MSIEDNAKREAAEERRPDPNQNPYSFWREPSKWFWWNILEKGRPHGDE